MKHYKTVGVPAKNETVLDRVTCDFCAAPIVKPGEYEFNEVEIRSSVGERYPDASHGVSTTIDCCPACWAAKVLPTLRTLLAPGAEPRAEEWDY
jgi:hypothetical protein